MWKGSAFSRATISIPNAVSKFTAVVFRQKRDGEGSDSRSCEVSADENPQWCQALWSLPDRTACQTYPRTTLNHECRPDASGCYRPDRAC
jgi:hypothetical protein